MSYRPDIDGLRALAVLAVVFCHAGLGLPGGYVGVDVFFVISGFLIAGLMLREMDAGEFSLVRFWERRIRRLFPALFVVTAASFVAGWFILVPYDYHVFGRAVTNLLLMQSNTFYGRLIDYFAPTSEQLPLLHTWSLAVEEQFYLIAPIAFLGLAKVRRSRLSPIVAATAMLSFAACLVGLHFEYTGTYFALSTRAWELLLGMLIAVRPVADLPFVSRRREAAAFAALASIVAPCFLYGAKTPFPGFAALPPVVGTMVLIVLGNPARPTTVVHRVLASNAARNIGLISYSLYLWHWPLIVFYKYLYITPPSIGGRLLLVAASLMLGALSYRWIEQPFRRRTFLATQPRLFGAALAGFASLMLCGYELRWAEGAPDRLPLHARLPEIEGLGSYSPRQVPLPGTEESLWVVGADLDSPPELLIWGDSHAWMLYPILDELCRDNGVVARSSVACGRPPLMDHPTAWSARKRKGAIASAAAVVEYVRTEKIPNVLLAARWEMYADDAFEGLVMQTVDALEAAGTRVHFLKSLPSYPFDVRQSLIRYAWRGHDPAELSLSLEEHGARHSQEHRLVEQLRERGVTVIDPVPALLLAGGRDRLQPFDAEGVFYFDTNHLTRRGAMALRPTFEPLIEAWAGPGAGPSLTAEQSQPVRR